MATKTVAAWSTDFLTSFDNPLMASISELSEIILITTLLLKALGQMQGKPSSCLEDVKKLSQFHSSGHSLAYPMVVMINSQFRCKGITELEVTVHLAIKHCLISQISEISDQVI